MKTFNIDGKEYSPGVWYVIDGNFVFMLNENGTNKFYFSITSGNNDDGTRTTHEQCDELALRIAAYLNADLVVGGGIN